MAFYFRHFPYVNYDSQKSGITQLIQNPLLRFRLLPLVEQTYWLYYDHIIREDLRVEDIAYNYYGDETLDWVILITNNILDPKFGWPMDNKIFQNFIIAKYGSVESSISEVSITNIHHYEWIVRSHTQTDINGIIPEKVIIVDETTYNTLLPAERRIVRNYEYENRLNESRRVIKLLKKDHLFQFVNEAKRLIIT